MPSQDFIWTQRNKARNHLVEAEFCLCVAASLRKSLPGTYKDAYAKWRSARALAVRYGVFNKEDA